MKRALTVYYREQDGEVGDIDFSEEFKKESTLMQADVIGDLISDLTERYNGYIGKGIVGGERKNHARKTQETHANNLRSPTGHDGGGTRKAKGGEKAQDALHDDKGT